jgi:hypothetical protein
MPNNNNVEVLAENIMTSRSRLPPPSFIYYTGKFGDDIFKLFQGSET